VKAALLWEYECSSSLFGLIAGLTVTFLAVCGAIVFILKKRHEEYWKDDENEGGCKDDYF
jgi:hypothetical protein